MRLHLSLLCATLSVVAACSLQFDGESYTGGPPQNGGGDAGAGTPPDATPPPSNERPDGAADRYRDEVMRDRPIAYFRLADETAMACTNEVEGSSITCAYPRSSAKRVVDGALSSADRALQLEASTALVTLLGELDFPGDMPFTLEAWFKIEAEGGSGLAKDMWFDVPSKRTGWTLFLDAQARVRSELWLEGKHVLFAQHASPITFGQFHHIVLSHSDVSHRDHVFVDGESGSAGTPADAGAPNRLSNDTVQTWGGFKGTLDEIAIYDVALPHERIIAHYLAR